MDDATREALHSMLQSGAVESPEEYFRRRGYAGLPGRAVREASDRFGASPRDVEILALEHDLLPLKYLRNLFGFSVSDQIALLRSNAALAGLGGLGGYMLELLARIGVGRIEAADGDRVEEHNLNRQILCGSGNLGELKADAARRRAAEANESVEVSLRAEFLDEAGFRGLLEGKDAGVDALGGLRVRRILQRAAADAGVPLVSAALAGEVGYVTTIYPGQEGPLSLWEGDEGAEISLGCAPHAVSGLASVQCAETVHILAGREPALKGKIAVLDLADFTWSTFEL
jgi:molybdopterin/thiamine biosynthesis adenylyltransferase